MSLVPVFSPYPTPAVSINYGGDAYTAADAASYTFTSQPFGTATSDRIICVGTWNWNYTRTLSSSTIGGVSGTTLVTTGGNHPAVVCHAAVSSGTTGTIVINWSGTNSGCHIAVWSVYGASASISDTATSTNDINPTVASIDCPAHGGVIGYAIANTGPHAWTGLTEDYDTGPHETHEMSGSHKLFSAAQTSLSVQSLTSAATTMRLAVVSYAAA